MVFSYFQYGSLICGLAIVPVAILGVIGNYISASVFRRQRTHAASSTYSLYSTSPKESRSSINILLISLTVVDTLLLILATPMCSSMAVYNYQASDGLLTAIAYMTLFTYPMAMICQCASVWIMILISLERYLAICRPLSARTFGGVGKTKKALLAVVGAAILYNACRFGEYKLNEFGNGTEPYLRNNTLYMTAYMNWSYFSLVFALPFLVLLIANILITRTIIRARRQREVIVHMTQNNRREQRTALMMAAVVLAYILCNILALILNGWEAVDIIESSPLFSFLSDLNNLLIEAHSGLTFLVYFRFSGHFRGFVYYQLRFVCYLRDGTLKSAWHWRGQRPTETLVERTRNLTLLMASENCRNEAMNARARRESRIMKEHYRTPRNTRLLGPHHTRTVLRNSAYIVIARGSLESHIDPFQV